MRLAGVCLILLGVAIIALASGCVTVRHTSAMIDVCLTDPDRDVLYCNGTTVPWKEAKDYVCYPIDQHEEYFEGCR